MMNDKSDAIDSFDDLFQRNDIKIMAFRRLKYKVFVEKYLKTDYDIKNFNNRLILFDSKNLYTNFTLKIINLLKDGNHVLVMSKSFTNGIRSKNNNNKWIKMLINILYESGNGFDDRFYSIYMSNSNTKLEHHINKLQV
jgi:hypothetical protein